MPQARKGTEIAEQAAKRASFPGRVEFLRLKDGDSAFVRMIDDLSDLINAEIHQAVPTKPAPKSNGDKKWPPLMSATCQNDPMFKLYSEAGEPLEEYEPDMGDCYIHKNYGAVLDRYDKPKSTSVAMVFGLCVLREPVRNAEGAIIRLKDVTEEWTDPKTKAKRQMPAFRILSQRYGNFWSPMKAGAFLDGSLTNKDWRIVREGNDYHISPLPPTPDHAPGTASWKTYTDAIELMKIDVFGMVAEQGSVEYYKKFFIPGDHDDAEEDGGSTAAEPESGAEVDPDELAAFKQRLMQGTPADASS